MTSNTGVILERYAYTAYGAPTITNASGSVLAVSAIGNRYLYTGREWDSTLAMYHYRARMFDASLGRFCSRDPIGYEGSKWSLFEYVSSNPIIAIDPLGLTEGDLQRPGTRPKDAPPGTLPIDKDPRTKERVHEIKGRLGDEGVGPKSYVGVTPDGHLIVTDSDGKAVDLGPYDDYLNRNRDPNECPENLRPRPLIPVVPVPVSPIVRPVIAPPPPVVRPGPVLGPIILIIIIDLEEALREISPLRGGGPPMA